MQGFSLSSKSRRLLEDVHPDLAAVVERALVYWSVYNFEVSEGLRTKDRQRELFAGGLSKTMDSKHLQQPDGTAHAVDIIARGDLDRDGDIDAQDRNLVWNRDVYAMIAQAMKGAADDLGVKIRWGGDFKEFFDGPHFELEA